MCSSTGWGEGGQDKELGWVETRLTGRLGAKHGAWKSPEQRLRMGTDLFLGLHESSRDGYKGQETPWASGSACSG